MRLHHHAGRRALLKLLASAGVTALPSAVAASFDDRKLAMFTIEEIFERFFFDPRWLSTPQARATFAALHRLVDTTSAPDQFGREFMAKFQGLGVSHVTRVQFSSMGPIYNGPIIVLTDGRTGSACEMVAEVLRSARGAVLVGAQTAGEMLVQRPFDVIDRFTLSLPVAGYVSHGNGWIEGVGLEPDIEVPSGDAFFEAFLVLEQMSPAR